MKRIAISVLTLAISVAAVSTLASAQDNGRGYNAGPSRTVHTDRAQVLRADPIGGFDRYQYKPNPNAAVTYEREECWNEQTRGYEGGYYRDNNGRLYRGDGRTNTNGMLIGALVGGALGNTVGKGDGRTAATVAGAVVGGAIGAHAGDHNDYEYRDDRGTVRRCRTIVTTTTDNSYDNRGHGGYNVTYSYAGQTYQAVMAERPGRWIRVTVDVRPQDDTRR